MKILDQVEPNQYNIGQPVQLTIIAETDLGYKAIVDGKYWGILYFNEVFQLLYKGQEIGGYIRKIRIDGRIDVSLYQAGLGSVAHLAEQILKKLAESGGFMMISDKTEAQQIYNLFGVSKKKFKIALGSLYKKRMIAVKEEGIELVSDHSIDAIG